MGAGSRAEAGPGPGHRHSPGLGLGGLVVAACVTVWDGASGELRKRERVLGGWVSGWARGWGRA